MMSITEYYSLSGGTLLAAVAGDQGGTSEWDTRAASGWRCRTSVSPPQLHSTSSNQERVRAVLWPLGFWGLITSNKIILKSPRSRSGERKPIERYGSVNILDDCTVTNYELHDAC